MPLRTPKFLNAETLFALAEYVDVDVPLQKEITERTTKHRKGGAKVGVGKNEAGGEKGSEIEVQTSYTLAPNHKAAVSKVVDQLIRDEHVTAVRDGVTLTKDLPVMVHGTARLTAASVAGKLLYAALQAMRSSGLSMDEMTSADMPASVEDMLKRVYLGNEMVPVPTLFELQGTGLPATVLLSVRPGHFVDTTSPDHLEGEVEVLATVETFLDENQEDGLSTEKWLLHDWEWTMRRTLMASLDHTLAGLAEALDVKVPISDIHTYVTGPAVVLDAVAVF